MGVGKNRIAGWILGPAIRAAALAAAIAAIAPGCSGHKAATAEDKTTRDQRQVAVTVEQAALRPIQRTVQFVGNFMGFDEITVMAEVTGRVVEVLHDVGDVVRPGDVLLRIDPTDYQLAVQETRRSLELEATRIGLPVPQEMQFTPEKILAALSLLDVNTLPPLQRAREQEDNARRKYERGKQLRENNTIPEETFEQYQSDYEVARRGREQTELDCRSVKAGIKHRLVLLQIAEDKLSHAQVTVPTPTRRAGMPDPVEYAVAKRKITEGEMLKDSPGASTAVFDLVLDKVLKLVATVPEQYLSEVKIGQKVEIREVEAFPGRTFEGKISRISPIVDRTKHSFEIEAIVLNANRDLKPGAYAKGAVLTQIDPQALVVPMASAVTFVGSTKVFVIRDDKAHAVAVTTGTELLESGADRRSWVELIKPDPKDIRPGTPVITSGHNQLAEGTPVTVRQPEQPAGPENRPQSTTPQQ